MLEETERNLSKKSPRDLERFAEFTKNIPFEVVSPSRDGILQAALYTETKDAPVIAEAKEAFVDYLVSLDRKHLVGLSDVSAGSGLHIVLPEELLKILRV